MATIAFGGQKFVRGNTVGDSTVESKPSTIVNAGDESTRDQFPIDADDSRGQHSDDGQDSIVDPSSIPDSSDAPFGRTATGRRRSKPVGSTSRGKRETGPTSKTSSDISALLFSMHMMGAAFLKSPQLIITEDEAKQLSDAVTRVTELYDVPLMDEKSRAWVNLAMVGASVYGTRVAAVFVERKRKPRNPVPQSQPRSVMGVVDFPQSGVM